MKTTEKAATMKEEFLHYVWKHRLFQFTDLVTTEGESLEIVFPGYHNTDAGPDFKQAVLVIGDMKWVGDVEIHVRSSDWFRHKHDQDEKYKSVILHVVNEYDRVVEIRKGECVPTLVLRELIHEDMFQRYEALTSSLDVISCRSYLTTIDNLYLQSLMSTLMMDRMLRKQESVREQVRQCQGDWQEALFRQLAMGFGFKTNSTAFELLARSLPYKVVKKHSDSIIQITALVFGQAGLLEESHVDDYYDCLKYEYDYLRYKYQLVPIEACRWNLLRLRPQNFPCLRLAQFSALLCAMPNMMETILHFTQVDEFCAAFTVAADPYWAKHYHFGKEKMLAHGTQLGSTAVTLLLINTVIPFLLAYYRFHGNSVRQEGVVAMLEQLPFEDNKLSRVFKDLPFSRTSALDSQAQIELLQRFCLKKRCESCAIGDLIIRRFREG